jgi:hypothetical protein
MATSSPGLLLTAMLKACSISSQGRSLGPVTLPRTTWDNAESPGVVRAAVLIQEADSRRISAGLCRKSSGSSNQGTTALSTSSPGCRRRRGPHRRGLAALAGHGHRLAARGAFPGRFHPYARQRRGTRAGAPGSTTRCEPGRPRPGRSPSQSRPARLLLSQSRCGRAGLS